MFEDKEMTEYIDLHIKLKGLKAPLNIRQLDKTSALAFVNALVRINYEIFKVNKKHEFINLIESITID